MGIIAGVLQGDQVCVSGAFVEIYLETQMVVKSMEPDKKLRF